MYSADDPTDEPTDLPSSSTSEQPSLGSSSIPTVQPSSVPSTQQTQLPTEYNVDLSESPTMTLDSDAAETSTFSITEVSVTQDAGSTGSGDSAEWMFVIVVVVTLCVILSLCVVLFAMVWRARMKGMSVVDGVMSTQMMPNPQRIGSVRLQSQKDSAEEAHATTSNALIAQHVVEANAARNDGTNTGPTRGEQKNSFEVRSEDEVMTCGTDLSGDMEIAAAATRGVQTF